MTTPTVSKSLNPTWERAVVNSFKVSSNRKFLQCVLWDAPSVVGAPLCLGAISIPVSDMESGRVYDMWVPLTPQHFLQNAGGELHLSFEYTYLLDKRLVEADQQATTRCGVCFSGRISSDDLFFQCLRRAGSGDEALGDPR